ncbi:MAG: hypothetical protein IT374_14540 [Polyangiaceae bacterium]|nr:hypothetical protein [Polyangiaceae bacterium]
MRRVVLAALTLATSARSAGPQLEWITDDGAPVTRVDVVRTPPAEEASRPADENSYRVRARVEGPAPVVRLRSTGERRAELGTLLPTMTPCRGGVAGCYESAPIRLVADAADLAHPASRGRSIEVSLGGEIEATLGDTRASARVLGPRVSPIGPLGLHVARLRALIVRQSPGGAPALGATVDSAVKQVRRQVARATTVWASCGISFVAEISAVDPPPADVVALGCEIGARAARAGSLAVVVDGARVTSAFAAGDDPRAAARKLSSALAAAGLTVELFDNRRSGQSGEPTVDLRVRRAGRAAVISRVESTDDALSICAPTPDFARGLPHFTDADAVPGTMSERALLRALDDGDPSTIEVVIVPSFATAGRIGESFIPSDDGTATRAILEDRAGVRADAVSFALAHELGHVLLDVPGHADDHGVDAPTRLMDSDAADPSVFGPRRLTVDECARAVRASGPGSRSPALREVGRSAAADARWPRKF